MLLDWKMKGEWSKLDKRNLVRGSLAKSKAALMSPTDCTQMTGKPEVILNR